MLKLSGDDYCVEAGNAAFKAADRNSASAHTRVYGENRNRASARWSEKKKSLPPLWEEREPREPPSEALRSRAGGIGGGGLR